MVAYLTGIELFDEQVRSRQGLLSVVDPGAEEAYLQFFTRLLINALTLL